MIDLGPLGLYEDIDDARPRARDSCTSYATENTDYLTRAVAARAALSWRLCGVEPATRTTYCTKHRPQQHQETYCPRLGLLLYYLGGPSRETGIRKPPDVRLPGSQPGPKLALSSQSTWTRPRRITGHPWACTSSEIVRRGRRETLFYKNLLRLTRYRHLVRNLLRP